MGVASTASTATARSPGVDSSTRVPAAAAQAAQGPLMKKGLPLLEALFEFARLQVPGPLGQALPILNILVLQTGQEPSVAGLPFFMVMGFGSFISRFTLHFRQ